MILTGMQRQRVLQHLLAEAIESMDKRCIKDAIEFFFTKLPRRCPPQLVAYRCSDYNLIISAEWAVEPL
jgi:hypothetical protein